MSQAGALSGSGGGGGGGNVSGPGSSTNRAIATWNGTTGTALFNNSTTNISSTGAFTNSGQPAFSVYRASNTATNLTGDGTFVTYPYDTVTFDVGSNFNTGTNTYTIPVSGIYLFTFNVYAFRVTGTNTVIITNLNINGTNHRLYELNFENMQTSGECVFPSSFLYQATAADAITVTVAVGGSAKNIGLAGGSTLNFFSGYLVC